MEARANGLIIEWIIFLIGMHIFLVYSKGPEVLAD
jgi:hypothetical protein